MLFHIVDNGIEKMRLAESGVTVYEKRVVCIRLLSHSEAGSLGEFVRRALYEVVECVVFDNRACYRGVVDNLGYGPLVLSVALPALIVGIRSLGSDLSVLRL